MKRKATCDIELPPLKHHNLVVKATPKPPKSPSRSKPKQQVNDVVQHVKFEDHQQRHDSEGDINNEDPTYASSEDKFEAQLSKQASDEATPSVEPPISKELECDTLGTTSDENNEEAFHVVRHQRSSKHVIEPSATRNLTHKEIEERAWRQPKFKFLHDNLDFFPSPPMPVGVCVTYILITEAIVQWMPKELIEDPQFCIQ